MKWVLSPTRSNRTSATHTHISTFCLSENAKRSHIEFFKRWVLSGHATQFYKKKIEDKRFWKKRWQFLSFSFFLSRSSNREYVQIKCQEIIQSTIFFSSRRKLKKQKETTAKKNVKRNEFQLSGEKKRTNKPNKNKTFFVNKSWKKNEMIYFFVLSH